MKIVAFMLFLFIPVTVFASFETLTIDNTAAGIGLTAVTSTAAAYEKTCWCGPLEAGQIRFKINGAAPTSSVGHLLEIGQSICLGESCSPKSSRAEIINFKGIRTGSTSGTLPCSCY